MQRLHAAQLDDDRLFTAVRHRERLCLIPVRHAGIVRNGVNRFLRLRRRESGPADWAPRRLCADDKRLRRNAVDLEAPAFVGRPRRQTDWKHGAVRHRSLTDGLHHHECDGRSGFVDDDAGDFSRGPLRRAHCGAVGINLHLRDRSDGARERQDDRCEQCPNHDSSAMFIFTQRERFQKWLR